MRTNDTERVPVRALLALAITVAVAAACVAPAPARSEMRRTTSTTTTTLVDPVPGYVRFELDPLSEYTVTMDPGLPGPVADAVRSAASEAQAASGIGLQVVTGSVGPVPGYGEITVTMGVSCGVEHEAGCATLWGYDGSRVITGAAVTVSPGMVGHRQLWLTVAHELAHALGLDHVDTQGFRPQVMGSQGAVLDSYQAGDVAGLADAGRDARAVPPGVRAQDIGGAGPEALHWHE